MSLLDGVAFGRRQPMTGDREHHELTDLFPQRELVDIAADLRHRRTRGDHGRQRDEKTRK
jgi:hypothetical protein